MQAFRIYLILYCVFFIYLSTEAQGLVLKNATDLLVIGESVQYLEDKNNSLSIEEVISSAYQQQFTSINNKVLVNFGTHSAYWVKLTMSNESGVDAWLDINTTYAWYIDFYAPQPDGKSFQKPILTGIMRGLESKVYPSNTFMLPLNKADETAPKTYYIKVKEEMPFELPLLLGSIQSLGGHKDFTDFITAAFIGLMFIILLYNIFLYFTVKDHIYIYYLGYLITYSLLVIHINNYSFFDLLPNYQWWYKHIIAWVVVSFFFIITLSILYLRLKKKAPVFYRILLIELGIVLLFLPLNLMLPLIDLIIPFEIAVVTIYLTLLAATYYRLFNGGKENRFYAIGWTFMVTLTFVYLGTLNGILPYTVMLRNAMGLGVGFEALFFSFALVDRYNRIRKQQLQSQKELVQKAQSELIAKEELLEKQHQIDKMQAEQREMVVFMEQREILRGSIDNLPIYVAMMDKTGRYLVVNKRYVETFNQKAEELEGKKYDEIPIAMHLDWRKPLVEKGLKGESSEFTRWIELPEGRSFYGYGRYTPVFDEDGQVKYLTVFVTDITQIKEKEQKLEELNATKDKLFSIIAHDLRSPLTTLSTMVSMFNEGDLEENEIRPMMEALSKNMNYTSQLIDNLLYWAKDQLKGEHHESVRFDLKALIEANLYLFGNKAEEKQISVSFDWNAGKSLAFADKNMIDLVIRNLVSNAIKFTPKGGAIRVTAMQKDDNLFEIRICDSGMGIAPERLSKTFTKNLNSTAGTENEKGTGLGLMLTKEFVEKNGGNIGVESQSGKGTTFYFTVPTAIQSA